MLNSDQIVWELLKERQETLLEEARIARLLGRSEHPRPALWQRLACLIGDEMIMIGQGLHQAAGISH